MKKFLCILLISLIATSSVGCGNLDTSKEIEENSAPENENTEQLEPRENSENEDFSKYEKYIDIVTGARLLFREFSKDNYPSETLDLLCVVDYDNLSSFTGAYNGKDCTLYKAEDVEKNLMNKFDITTEELRTKLEYIEEQNAYPKRTRGDGVGSWTIIKDVKEKDHTFEIYYENWFEASVDFTGKLTINKEGKIISNSDIKHY